MLVHCFEMGQTFILCLGRNFKGAHVPLGWSGLGSVIENHSDHGASKELMNPL